MKRDTDTTNVARGREVSKQLFGNMYRLEVGAAIALLEPGVFYARQVARSLGLADNVVQGEIRRFEAAGAVRRLDTVPGQRALYFQRIDSEFWSSCVRIAAELDA